MFMFGNQRTNVRKKYAGRNNKKMIALFIVHVAEVHVTKMHYRKTTLRKCQIGWGARLMARGLHKSIFFTLVAIIFV
jgi:hypothetical protein